MYPKGGISDKPAGRYKLITLLFPTPYSEEKRRFSSRNYVISALDYTIRCFLFFRFNQARFNFFGKGLPFHLSQWELVKGQFFQLIFLKAPPKNAFPFQTSEGAKNLLRKRVSILSFPVGTSERINFFGDFLAEHRFWVCILTPFVQMSERKFYLWFPKYPIIFPFPVRTSEGI